MSRYSVSLPCTHAGCRERDYYACYTRKEQSEVNRRRATYLCLRHRTPEEVLSVDNPVRETVLVATERFYEDPPRGTRTYLFWAPEGSENGGSGFAYGAGFKAYAEDFPAGTRLITTARVEL